MARIDVSTLPGEEAGSMLKRTGDQSDIEKPRKTQSGLAASLSVWIQKVALSGFAGLGRNRGDRRMELMETLHLGGKRQLMLVLCDGQKYLVGAGSDSVHSIAEIGRQQHSSLLPLAIGGSVPQVQPEIASPNAEREMRWGR